MKEALASAFVQYVVPALFTAIALLVAWGGKKLIEYLNAKTGNALVAGILARLTAAVQTVVLDVNGTVKAAYLKASADGVITKDEAAALKKLAIDRVKLHLGSSLAQIVSVLGISPETVDEFIGSHVEAAIEGMKVEPPVASTPEPVANP